MNDGHICVIAKDYYNDKSFCRESNGGNQPLEHVQPIHSGKIESSYIDTFLDRGVNAFSLSKGNLKCTK